MKKLKYKGPKAIDITGKRFCVGQTLTHSATKNKFQIKEIQSKGFIVWLTESLGAPTVSTTDVYLSYGTLDQYV